MKYEWCGKQEIVLFFITPEERVILGKHTSCRLRSLTNTYFFASCAIKLWRSLGQDMVMATGKKEFNNFME